MMLATILTVSKNCPVLTEAKTIENIEWTTSALTKIMTGLISEIAIMKLSCFG